MIEDPSVIAWNYLSGTFIYDAVSTVPYHIFRRDLLFLRLVRLRKFNIYKDYLS
jgi:hypothetical protein